MKNYTYSRDVLWKNILPLSGIFIVLPITSVAYPEFKENE